MCAMSRDNQTKTAEGVAICKKFDNTHQSPTL